MKRMFDRVLLHLACLAVILLTLATSLPGEEPLWIGISKFDITPRKPVVLAGYGSRTKPYESIETKLWGRVLVIGKNDPVAFVVLDNCGVTREITRKIRFVLEHNGFRSRRVNVAATHTHNAPNLVGYAPILWQGRQSAEQIRDSENYTSEIVEKTSRAVLKAHRNVFRAKLSWGQGRVTFGGNRRMISDGKWAGFGFQPDAPVDHSLPMLVVRDEENRLKAIWCNYACHCTTLGSRNVVAGDWAGYANESIEAIYPGVTSLVSIGCGADVGPQPSGNSELAKKHGLQIANEVKRIVDENQTVELKAQPTVESRTLQLPLEDPKAISHWEALARTRGFDKQLARKMLKEIEAKGAISKTVEYPISIWKFDKQLAIVFMPGEVVVDYAVRLKTELDWERLWITGWTNRMPGYIPSKKVLMQGGYEADFSQTYYGLPGRYKPEVEDLIVRNIRALAGTEFDNRKELGPSPYHQSPGMEQITFDDFVASYLSKTDLQKQIIERAGTLIPVAISGMAGKTSGSSRRDRWFDLSGNKVERVFIRQESSLETISWKTSPSPTKSKTVFCFTGGLGWLSQPLGKGFKFEALGDSAQIDVVREPAAWKSQNGRFELLYVPTWHSNEDSGGFFFLVPHQLIETGDSIACTMRSMSTKSQRWFGLDVNQNNEKNLKKLAALLERIKPQSQQN